MLAEAAIGVAIAVFAVLDRPPTPLSLLGVAWVAAIPLSMVFRTSIGDALVTSLLLLPFHFRTLAASRRILLLRAASIFGAGAVCFGAGSLVALDAERIALGALYFALRFAAERALPRR